MTIMRRARDRWREVPPVGRRLMLALPSGAAWILPGLVLLHGQAQVLWTGIVLIWCMVASVWVNNADRDD